MNKLAARIALVVAVLAAPSLVFAGAGKEETKTEKKTEKKTDKKTEKKTEKKEESSGW